MATTITVHTQIELDAALAGAVEHETEIFIVSPETELISVQTTKKICIVARGSSHVVARGSSHVVARGSSHVVAWGSVQIRAVHAVSVVSHSKFVVVTQQHPAAQITGPATVIPVPPILTATDWIVYYGAQPSEDQDDTVILYKAVRDNYCSSHGFLYEPGTLPQAPDWDGGKDECGGGLHFCATPLSCLCFDIDATRFVACPVRISDIVVHQNPVYPQKIKAPGLCAPCWEVDRYGNALSSTIPAHEETTP